MPGIAAAFDAVALLGFAAAIGVAVPLDAAAATVVAARLDVVASLEAAGSEAAKSNPTPLPKTSRPPPPIVINPLLGNAAAVAIVRAPSLIVVPPL